MLAVSGGLDRSPGGPHPFPPEWEWRYTQHNPFVDDFPTDRRSVYLMQQRIRLQPFLATFDGADTNASTGQRKPGTTPQQALFMLNSEFAHEQAGRLADRLASEADEPGRPDRPGLPPGVRPPADREEVREGLEYLDRIDAPLRAAGIADAGRPGPPGRATCACCWAATSSCSWTESRRRRGRPMSFALNPDSPAASSSARCVRLAAAAGHRLGAPGGRGGPPRDADPLAPKAPHFPGKAKRVIYLFMTGGVSHLESFDPKPKLAADAGKKHKGRTLLPPAVQVHPRRQVRHAGQRAVPARRHRASTTSASSAR